MPAIELSIVDEVETALDTGSAEKRLETVKRVTDLFLSSAGSYKNEQIELFDTVLERLIKTIEIRAIADVSARIAAGGIKHPTRWRFAGAAIYRPPPCRQ